MTLWQPEPEDTDPRFVEHQRSDIFWLADPAFDSAFRDLTGDTSMTEAAFTKSDASFPGYVNAQLGDNEMVLTVRGDPLQRIDGHPHATSCAPTTQLRIPLDDWDQFIADAQRVRAGAG